MNFFKKFGSKIHMDSLKFLKKKLSHKIAMNEKSNAITKFQSLSLRLDELSSLLTDRRTKSQIILQKSPQTIVNTKGRFINFS